MPVQLVIAAPYGRHKNRPMGPEINNRLGWAVMELSSLATILSSYVFNLEARPNPAIFFVLLWSLHYVNRSVVFPLQLKSGRKGMPILILLSAILFNVVNASINGYYFARLSSYSFTLPCCSPRFIIGILLFASGAAINIVADQYLIQLRKTPGDGYKIPRHFLFRLVSCPNHLGELIEWSGFALAASSLPALAFLVWTISNLVPRSLHHHRWYKTHFPDYPPDRKAILPFFL